LEDIQQVGGSGSPQLVLPLNRLVFNNGTGKADGKEFLCIVRADRDGESSAISADMSRDRIKFGSLAVAAFYTVLNPANHTVGLASRGSPAEGSDSLCLPSVSDQCSPMQSYFPPGNVCEDPPCGEYWFMRLDEASKECVWSVAVPVSFFLMLITLAALELLSNRLYKQAVEKAGEFRA
jgi:hypothetical protein